MEIIKYVIISSNDKEMMIIVQDGGIATCYHNEEHIITEYYQDRIEKDNVGSDDFWDILGEGKMYCNDWLDKQTWDDEVVQNMLEWLCCSTGEFSFTKCELNFDDNDAVRNFIQNEQCL